MLCPSIGAPDNGAIDCSGSCMGDTCTVTCDPGYELSGSATRTCQDDGSWSGTEAVCVIGEILPWK